MKIKGLEDAILRALKPWPNSWMAPGGDVDVAPNWMWEEAQKRPEYATWTFLPEIRRNEWHFWKYQEEVRRRDVEDVTRRPSLVESINTAAHFLRHPPKVPRLQDRLPDYPRSWRGLIEFELRRSGRWIEKEAS